MIYIIDNGGEWSDHELLFVESSRPKEEIETYLRLRCGREYWLVAAAERFEWYEGGARMLGEEGYQKEDPDDSEPWPAWVHDEIAAARPKMQAELDERRRAHQERERQHAVIVAEHAAKMGWST